jgi:hypothetical protein
MAQTANLMFRAVGFEEALQARTPEGVAISRTAARDLRRLYAALEAGVPRSLELNAGEAAALMEAVATIREEPRQTLLWAKVSQALARRGELATADVLAGKLRTLTDLEALAVVDAVERCELLTGNQTERLRAVGLIR